MAFNKANLAKFDNAVGVEGSKVSQYVYKSSAETLAVITAAAYFNDAGFQDLTTAVTKNQTKSRTRQLDVDCLIYIIGSDGAGIRRVTANGSTGDVTVAALA